MNVTPPEARSEYSTGDSGSRDDFPLGIWLGLGALVAAAMLVVAELTALFTEHVAGRRGVQHMTGSHNAYALVPLAVVVVILAVGVWRLGSRPALLAIGVIGVAALLVALLKDLPDAHQTGKVVRTSTNQYLNASTTPSAGFYLESGGAVLLIVVCVGGFILAGPPPRSTRRPRRDGGAVPRG